MLKGKTALVTGSTSGIGLGIARALAGQGANIVLNGFGDTEGPRAAIAALDNPEIPRRIHAKYKRRLEKLVRTLRSCGFTCEVPGGSYFLYTAAPKGVAGGPQFANAEEASQYFITEHSTVIVPWDDAGSCLRFSVTYEADDEVAEDALMAETARRLGSLKLVF